MYFIIFSGYVKKVSFGVVSVDVVKEEIYMGNVLKELFNYFNKTTHNDTNDITTHTTHNDTNNIFNDNDTNVTNDITSLIINKY